jgi:hypothetical protein
MKKAIKAFFILISCLSLHTGFCQIALHIELSGTPPPSSIDSGQTFSFDVSVRNDSAATFRGRIGFGYSIDGAQYIAFDSTLSGFSYVSSIADSIRSGDSIIKTITGHVVGPAFKTGPSVVVIWPIAVSGAPVYAEDSLNFTITITLATSIDGIDDDRIKLWLINDKLWFQLAPEISISRVRMFDILGNEILDKPNPLNNITLPEMNKGVYMAEITYNNNQRKVFRFYH